MLIIYISCISGSLTGYVGIGLLYSQLWENNTKNFFKRRIVETVQWGCGTLWDGDLEISDHVN